MVSKNLFNTILTIMALMTLLIVNSASAETRQHGLGSLGGAQRRPPSQGQHSSIYLAYEVQFQKSEKSLLKATSIQLPRYITSLAKASKMY